MFLKVITKWTPKINYTKVVPADPRRVFIELASLLAFCPAHGSKDDDSPTLQHTD